MPWDRFWKALRTIRQDVVPSTREIGPPGFGQTSLKGGHLVSLCFTKRVKGDRRWANVSVQTSVSGGKRHSCCSFFCKKMDGFSLNRRLWCKTATTKARSYIQKLKTRCGSTQVVKGEKRFDTTAANPIPICPTFAREDAGGKNKETTLFFRSKSQTVNPGEKW